MTSHSFCNQLAYGQVVGRSPFPLKWRIHSALALLASTLYAIANKTFDFSLVLLACIQIVGITQYIPSNVLNALNFLY